MATNPGLAEVQESVEFVVTSSTGHPLAIFNSEPNARESIQRARDRGVDNQRLFKRTITFEEVKE